MTIEEARHKEKRWNRIINYLLKFKNGLLESELREWYKEVYPDHVSEFESDLSGLTIAQIAIPLGVYPRREFIHRAHKPTKHPRHEPLKFHRSTP